MNVRTRGASTPFAFVVLITFTLAAPFMSDARAQTPDPASGVVRVKSAYSVQETVARIKKDVADKGIMWFSEVDQQQLAANAGIKLRPSTLLTFGNPPLGTLFIKANPVAGLDWPVRVLVLEDENGQVWAAYTDFGYIARRHNVGGADAESFAKASGVIASITSSVE